MSNKKVLTMTAVGSGRLITFTPNVVQQLQLQLAGSYRSSIKKVVLTGFKSLPSEVCQKFAKRFQD